jgi:hypothetical protein
MALETSTIEHSCNVVRRQVQEEWPDLALNFIVYHEGKLAKALDQKREEIKAHPAGKILLPLLKEVDPERSFFIAARAQEKKLLSFMARKKTLACVFFPADAEYADTEQVRQQAYAMAWHMLNAPAADNTAARPAYKNETERAWHNMLADAFSALVIEMQGKKGFIRTLARRRSTLALEAHARHAPEDYPYPVVMDAAQLVYDDMRRIGGLMKGKILSQALEVVREIGMTFDQNTVLQWWAFSRPAQEMAWLGIDKHKILNAAIHTSEDPYARSTAYMVAEMLSIDPAPVSDISLYNAFTDQEANERHHRKLCDHVFQKLISKVTPLDNGTLFRLEADKQNRKLLEGQLVGWCAPGLIAAAAMFDKPLSAAAKMEETKRVYAEACRKTNSEILQKLGHILVTLRRAGEILTLERIAEAVRQDEHVLVQDLSDALMPPQAFN